MPLFLYLPVIIWSGLMDVMLGVATHDRDELDAQSDAMIAGANVLPFRGRN
jgi:hypothetical protein